MTMAIQHAGRCLTLVLSKEISLSDQAQGKVLEVTLGRQAEPGTALFGHRMGCASIEAKRGQEPFKAPLIDVQADQPT